MPKWTRELKVGLFVVAMLALVVFSYFWASDGLRAGEQSYALRMSVDSAEGIYAGSRVKMAGVEVGEVGEVRIAGGHAEIILRLRELYQLPVDSEAELKSSGLLGDMYVRVHPGLSELMKRDGDVIETRAEPGDLDVITRNLEKVSDDISAITGVLRKMAENDANREHIEATLANVDVLSQDLREIASSNKQDIAAIIDSVRRLTEALEGHVDDIAGNVNDELDALQDLTAELHGAAEDIQSISGKIDRGEGTIGALVNDRRTIDTLNETLDDVRMAVRSFTGVRPEIYYNGRFYMGTQPKDTETFFYGNPLAWSAANAVGLRLRAHEDFWYLFEINDVPQGVISQREVYRQDTGEVRTKWVRDAKFRFTFQMEKRWGHFSFRLGIRENGGGVGATYYTAKDKVQVNLDVFDFFAGSYPAVESSGIPNVRVGVRVEPWKNIYVEAGAEQVILGAKYGYFTGYIGAGFRFTDDDIKLLLGSLPLSF